MATMHQLANSPALRGKNVTSMTPITLSDGRMGYHVTYTENQERRAPGNAARAAGKIASAPFRAALWTAKTAWKLAPGKQKLAQAWSGWLANAIWISAVVFVTWQIAIRV